jgi:hypothetical protein
VSAGYLQLHIYVYTYIYIDICIYLSRPVYLLHPSIFLWLPTSTFLHVFLSHIVCLSAHVRFVPRNPRFGSFAHRRRRSSLQPNDSFPFAFQSSSADFPARPYASLCRLPSGRNRLPFPSVASHRSAGGVGRRHAALAAALGGARLPTRAVPVLLFTPLPPTHTHTPTPHTLRHSRPSGA